MILNSSFYRNQRVSATNGSALEDGRSLLHRLQKSKWERIAIEDKANTLEKNIQKLLVEEHTVQKNISILKKKSENLLEARKTAQYLSMIKEQAKQQKEAMVIRQFELNKYRKSESVMNKSIVFADYQNMIANVGNLIREQIEKGHELHRKDMETHIISNCKKAIKAKMDEKTAFRKKLNFLIQQHEVARDTYKQKISLENLRIKEKNQQMRSLVEQRNRLVQRLDLAKRRQYNEIQNFEQIKNTRFNATFSGSTSNVSAQKIKDVISGRESSAINTNSTDVFTTKRSRMTP